MLIYHIIEAHVDHEQVMVMRMLGSILPYVVKLPLVIDSASQVKKLLLKHDFLFTFVKEIF